MVFASDATNVAPEALFKFGFDVICTAFGAEDNVIEERRVGTCHW
jgi:hypothetical protein